MRAFGMLLWLAVLGFCVFNWWQIRSLRQELEAQRTAVRVTERSPGLLRKLDRALERGERARKMLEQGRYRDAANELDGAINEFGEATKDTDRATEERIHQVEETLAQVREQAQGLMRRVTPGREKSGTGG